jgi:rhamnosyltransferase
MSPKILAVIILYHPKNELIGSLVKNCLHYSGCDVFLSDNAEISRELKNQFESSRIIYRNNKGNVGVGAAQNRGLRFALEKKYEYAVLFDQDSQIGHDFLEKLIREFESAREKDSTIIAVAPSYIDPRFEGEKATMSSVSHNTYQKTVIASGCIFSLPELGRVGLMDEKLFIDFVDIEWCYRAISRGFHIMQLSNVVMNHTIGEVKTLWWGRKIQYHHYFRYYYFFRNSLLLARKNYIPIRDRAYFLFRPNVGHIVKILFLDHKWLRIKGIFKGIWDGLTMKSC